MSDSALDSGAAQGQDAGGYLDLFEAAGILAREVLDDSRRLIFDLADCRVLVVRSQDVITYVEHGAADIGVVGKDVLLERSPRSTSRWTWGSAAAVWRWPEPVARPRRPAKGAPASRGDQVPEAGGGAFPPQGRAGRDHQALRLHRTGAARGSGRPDRGSGEHGGDAAAERASEVEETILGSTSRLIVNRATMKTRTAEVLGLVGRLKERLEKAA